MSDSNYYFTDPKSRGTEANPCLHFKLKPKPLSLCDSSLREDFRKFIESSDAQYDFQIKTRSTHYLCLLKSYKTLNELFLVALDENIVMISQFSMGDSNSGSLQGFSHSFEVPYKADLTAFEVFSDDRFLLIIIPRD